MILKAIRKVLGAIILFWDRFTHPKGLLREPDQQALVDAQTQNLTLYHMQACPFCVKTRREVSRLGLHIQMRDILKNPVDGETLVREGGLDQVPCLRISENGTTRWLYESSDINRYLRSRFGAPETSTYSTQSP